MVCRGQRWLLAVLAAAAIAHPACQPGDPSAARQIEPQYDEQTGRLKLLKYDSDKDGRVDTTSYMDGARVLRIEIDKDQDGKVERWEYYGADRRLEKVGFSRSGDGKEDAWSFAGPDGSVARIEIAGAGDGKITRTEFYEKESPVRAQEDTDGDGLMDKWETFEAGRLASVAFDTAHRGSPDRRLIYPAAGDVRIEVDPDGDGRFTSAKP
jgi:hypothetical protein